MGNIDLVIKQTTGSEQVNAAVIDKLYNLTYENAAQGVEAQVTSTSSDIVGNIIAPAAYEDAVTFLREKFPNLIITVQDNNYYIRFEDANVLQVLLDAGYGDSIGVTRNEAATVNSNKLFCQNTDIINFDEFKYFTYYQSNNSELFLGCSNLESIDLTNITVLNFQALRSCTKLKYFNGKNSEPYTLSLPNLSTVTDRNALTSLTSLQHVTSLGNINKFGDGLFYGCTSLIDVVVPDNISIYNQSLFGECTNLVSITCPSGNSIWDSITSIGQWAFSNCQNLEIDDLSIPNLTSVGQGAFYFCKKIKKVSNFGSIVSYPTKVFYTCDALTSIDLTNAVSIGENAFRDCVNLKYFGGDGSTMGELNLPNLEAALGAGAFRWCTSLTKITSLGNCTTLNNEVFQECTSLVSIEQDVLNKLTSIGVNTFYKCSALQLTTLSLPNLTSIDRIAFSQCTNLLHIKNLGTITSLVSKYANDGTFYGCSGLLDAVLPETLTAIGLCEFGECKNIRYIKILSTSVPTYNLTSGFGSTQTYGKSFGENYRNNDLTSEYLGCTYPIYVLDELLEEYKAADGWKTVGPSSNGYDKTNLCERLKPMSQFATDFPDEE